jgi:hypothetical protein
VVGGPAGAQQQAGHVPLPVLRSVAARDERARPDLTRGRLEPPAPRAQLVRHPGARRGDVPDARRLARRPGPEHEAAAQAALAAATGYGVNAYSLLSQDGTSSMPFTTILAA